MPKYNLRIPIDAVKVSNVLFNITRQTRINPEQWVTDAFDEGSLLLIKDHLIINKPDAKSQTRATCELEDYLIRDNLGILSTCKPELFYKTFDLQEHQMTMEETRSYIRECVDITHDIKSDLRTK